MLQGVTAADYSPDGQSLAVVRLVSGKYRLEYPSGKTLFETAGSITQPRVSRDGKRVAFLFHPVRGDDRGSVMVVDAGGKSALLSDGWEGEQGLAWGAGGDEIWFSASKASGDLTLHAVTLSGKTRNVFAGPGGTRIFDIGPDGRFLVSHNDFKYSVTASVDGAQERDLSWLDNSFSPSLSSDGKRILFSDGASQSSGFYTLCLRTTDGSPVIRLGEGAALGFSPDGAWALALLDKTPPEVEVLPTGPGEVRRWLNQTIEGYSGIGWMPDSQEVIFSANEPGHGFRFSIQKIGGGAIRPITSEGFSTKFAIPVSPDGKQFFAVNDQTGAWNLCHVDEGKCGTFSGIVDNDIPLRWSVDGKYVYTGEQHPVPAVYRIELATGHRQLWKQLSPADSVGALEFFPASITPDGKSIAMQYDRSLDQLYTVEGVN